MCELLHTSPVVQKMMGTGRVTRDGCHSFRGRSVAPCLHGSIVIAAEAGSLHLNNNKGLPAPLPTSNARLKWVRGIVSCRPPREANERQPPMTVSSPNVIELKLERLIEDMRLLRSQMIAFDNHLKGLEASLKPSEPSEQRPESKSRPWFAAAASATARTVLILFAVGAATSAALFYLGT